MKKRPTLPPDFALTDKRSIQIILFFIFLFFLGFVDRASQYNLSN